MLARSTVPTIIVGPTMESEQGHKVPVGAQWVGHSTLARMSIVRDAPFMTTDCVVGIDGSDVSVDALRWAARNRPRPTDPIVAVGAWHVPLPMKLLMAKRSFDVGRLGIAAEAQVAVDHAIAALGDHDGSIERRVTEGHAASVLLTQSADAQMLVIGRRGDSELAHLVVGSVSRHCATHAVVPTVIVPPGYDEPRARTIVIGFDGSENACAALQWALDHFDDDATFRLIAAIDVSPWLDVESTLQRFPAEVNAEEQRLTTAADSVDPERRATREILLHGPKQALAEASGTADIIVLGARGHGAIGSALLGSISTWMLHESPCPIAIVPIPG